MYRCFAVILIGCTAWAHDPVTTPLTWSKEVSRLLAHRCQGCHQAGGKAPFALMTYQDARPWAVAIRDEVSNRTMPPWNAVKGFGSFRGEMALSQEEIQTITDWVNGGAPEGDPALVSTHVPGSYQPEEAPAGSRLVPAGPFARATELLGLRIEQLPKDAGAHVYLQTPDGARQPLLWVRRFNPAAPRLYLLAEPVAVPARSRIVAVTAAPNARFLAVVPGASRAPGRAGTPGPVGE